MGWALIVWQTVADAFRLSALMIFDVIVVGAGVAGLTTARGLVQAGRKVLVVDRARGVGGRCATRRFDQQPVDYGPVFLHGSDPSFLTELSRVPGATVVSGWPAHIEGHGPPCQPEALNANEQRLALAEGLSAFPKSLAQGLAIQLSTPIQRLTIEGSALQVHATSGEVLQAADVVVALALEQSRQLLATLPESRDLAAIQHLLGMLSSVPCLSLIATYDRGVPMPEWDILYPGDSDCLQLISNDSAKRISPRRSVLVLQARPRWSRQRIEIAPEVWGEELLHEAAHRLGPWVLQPRQVHPHRWRYARLERGTELAQPIPHRPCRRPPDRIGW